MINKAAKILVIRSDKTELERVEKFVKDIFDEYSIPKSCFNKVFLCVSEATINSIVHGNNSDHQKKVELLVDCERNLINVKVTDEGEGFNFNDIPDPTSVENLLKESGRGLHIIKSMSTIFRFNNKGNSLEFQLECR